MSERLAGSCTECGAYLSNEDAENKHAAWHLATNSMIGELAAQLRKATLTANHADAFHRLHGWTPDQ